MLQFQRAAFAVFALISVVSLQGCRRGDTDYVEPTQLSGRMVGNRYCDQVDNLVAMGLIDPDYAGSESAAKRREEAAQSTTQSLYASLWSVWPMRQIPVCWEDASYDPAHVMERFWVQDQVAKTWEAALCGDEIPEAACLKFVGWTRCSEGDKSGIRIQVSDAVPHAVFFGNRLAGIPAGVRFNFTFASWSQPCAVNESEREFCIRAIAAHEFGHALGLAHEQNRGDTPDTCDQAPQGGNGDTYLGPWDENSIMNYCAPRWNGDGQLSEGDKEWIRAAYYPEYYDELCVPLRVYDSRVM